MLPSFTNPDLLARALTHSSYANENVEGEKGEKGETRMADNEKLEFLGDAVLDFVTGAWLYENFPDLDEGRLTSVRAALVRVTTLAEFARSIGLPDMLRLGKGELDTGGRNRANILGDAFEAVIGALYLDQGIGVARAFIEQFLSQAAPGILNDNKDRDAKSRLQEWAQAELNVTPRYKLASTDGPDHAKVFNVQVWLGGRISAIGSGSSKQAAEQLAARESLAVEMQLKAEREAAQQAQVSAIEEAPNAK
jgi:ribonuclease-3